LRDYFVRIAWAAIKRANVVSFVERNRLAPMGSPANWRCIVLEKLNTVELLVGSWKTAPNHSRPTTCVIEADIDADDQPDDTRQNGQ